MTNRRTKQAAELRVTYERDGRYALVARVTIRGSDVYFGLRGEKEEDLSSSYHETGQSHTKVAGGRKRLIDKTRPPVQGFRGLENVWQVAPDPEDLDWNYRLQAERGSRRNLTVNLDTPGGVVPTVDIWMVERGGVSQLADVMQSYRDSRVHQFIDCRIIDWTQPWILALVWRPKDEVLESLRKYIEDSGLPTDGLFGGMVTGPGPPTGRVVKVWPEPEENAEITE